MGVTVHGGNTVGAGRGSAEGAGGRYRVQNGDTLGTISRRVGVGVRKLAAVSGIVDPDVISVGEVLGY